MGQGMDAQDRAQRSEKVLEKKSEANKDQDHSVGVVFLVVA